jgi:hypothetical protein
MTTLDEAVAVGEGNPGALTVLSQLQYFTKWPEMVHYLRLHGPRGADLWVLYKDVHGHSISDTGREILSRMVLAEDAAA